MADIIKQTVNDCICEKLLPGYVFLDKYQLYYNAQTGYYYDAVSLFINNLVFFFFYELFIWSVFFRIHHCFITRKLDVTTIMMSRVLPMSFIRGHWLIMYGQQKLLNDMLRLFSVFLIVIYIFLLFLLFSYFIFLFFIISVYSVN